MSTIESLITSSTDSPILFTLIQSVSHMVFDDKDQRCEELLNKELKKFKLDFGNELNRSKTSARIESIDKLFEYDKDAMQEVKNALDSELSFFEDKDKSNVLKNLDDMTEILYRFQMTNQFSRFPTSSELENYLSCYFNVCRFLFCNSALLYEEFNYNEHLQTVCEYLTYAPALKNCNIYSPYCAEALLTFYECAEQLQNNSDFTLTHPIVKNMIAYIFATKAFRGFRNFVVRDTKTALLSCENTDHFVEKKSYNLSNYELINPICLFGKIKRYLLNKQFNTDDCCNIIIVGAIYISLSTNKMELKDYSSEFNELCEWLSESSDTRDHKFVFDIYINKRSMPSQSIEGCTEKRFNSGKINVNFYFEDYKTLIMNWTNKNSKDCLLDREYLLLILDCPFLYENLHIVTNSINTNNYFKHLPAKYSKNDLSLSECGAIQKIQKQLNMLLLNRFNETGHFERRIKERLIKRIADIVGSQKKSEAFIFISSQHSIEASVYSRNYAVRIERYNAKEIGLLHFDSTREFEVVCNPKDENNNEIIFSLWNIIINTGIGILKEMGAQLNIGAIDVKEYVSNIYIYFRWNKNKDLFREIEIQISDQNSKISNTSTLKILKNQ